MKLSISTWNINSVRLRKDIVLRFLRENQPDILCLQETKSPVEKIPAEVFAEAGYTSLIARGQKGYNGVAILSKLPMEDAGSIDFCEKGDARHVAARHDSGLVVHNYYVPAGGDVADPEENPKFAHKLGFLRQMQANFTAEKPVKSVLVGDLNIAPLEDDVWSHKQLLKVVSHTPVEVDLLTDVQNAGEWQDITRADFPEGKLYSWWSYRARDWAASNRGRRLDHIWASSDLEHVPGSSKIFSDIRGWEQPSDHVPVIAEFNV